jgi:sterol desaturase/sphingolipid hydroxylase (fatty acid hydroxylase superfamily)
MDVLTWAFGLLTRPVTRLAEPLDTYGLPTLIGGLLFAVVSAAVWRMRRKRRLPRLRALARFLFSRRVLAHRSSRLDYKLYVVNTLLMSSVLAVFYIGSGFWQARFAALLSWLGPAAQGGEPSWGVTALTVTLSILTLDFGYWLAHYVCHKVPWMWEFHKVHHSAEVMTPATELRQHPVELFFFPLVYGFTAGSTYAAISWAFGDAAQAIGLHGVNVILALHLLTFHHLRHSHVALPFTGAWGVILHSPAHHQIHHSADPKHFDRNLGYLFSVWDWMFGTLWRPRQGEKITLGVGHEGEAHDSVYRVFVDPCVLAWREFKRSFAIAERRRPTEPAE